MISDAHYQFSSDTPLERITSHLLRDSIETTKIQWLSDGGGEIYRSVSEVGLERWQLRAFTMNTLERMRDQLIKGIQLVCAERSLKMFPTYPERDYFVGWLFWHWEEER